MPPEPIRRLVERARPRLTAMNTVNAVVVAVGVTAAAAAGLLAVARRVVLPWAEPAAATAVAVGVIGAIVVAMVKRPSPARAALEIDHRLGGRDQVSTALELSTRDGLSSIEERQVGRAASWAEARELDGFGSLVPRRRLILLSALAVAGAFVLAIPASPADAARDRAAEVRAELDVQADALEEAADRVADERIAQRLAQLAEELRQAADLAAADQLLGNARQELAELADAEALGLKTALAGLDRRLQQDPVAAGDDARSQLEALRTHSMG